MLQRDLPSHWDARFFLIWTGQAFPLFGSMRVQFALVWWLTKTTGSATVLGLAAMVALLPQVFLGPFVGALLNRCPHPSLSLPSPARLRRWRPSPLPIPPLSRSPSAAGEGRE